MLTEDWYQLLKESKAHVQCYDSVMSIPLPLKNILYQAYTVTEISKSISEVALDLYSEMIFCTYLTFCLLIAAVHFNYRHQEC